MKEVNTKQINFNDYYRKSETVVGRRIIDNYILVPLAQNTADLDSIFRLNSVGAFIWENFDGQTPGTEIIQRIVKEFDVTERRATEDFEVFVAQLASVQIVETISNEK